MEIKEMTMEQLEERKAAIREEINAEDADLASIESEIRSINEEIETRRAEEAKKEEIRKAVAEKPIATPIVEEVKKMSKTEERANALASANRYSLDAEETRSILISGGTLATPTEVSGINDMIGGGNVSVLDLVNVVNCLGMGTHRVSYVSAETATADAQTEGSAASNQEPTFAYIDITPTNVACYAQISKQAKKQSPLQYEAKVSALALKALKKKAVAIIASQLKASTICQTLTANLDASHKGVIDENTLRKIAFAYGGNDEIDGGAVLFLNKTDLVAFGDVRGTNEKKAIYQIMPDGSNPNRGTISDGGLVVNYCIMSGLTACKGTEYSSTTAQPTMFYGNPQNFELDLFSNYEVRVSEDYAFTALMDTIVGDVEVGGNVVVKNGFVAYTIPKNG